MPKDERALLLLLGYAANQVSMLQKLLNFATNHTWSFEVEQVATGVQTQMLARLMAGALNEAWILVSTRFIQNPLSRDYLSRLDPGGKQALDALKQLFGRSNLLNAVRNNFAFHYPDTDQVEAAFDAALDDRDLDDLWNLYFSHHGFNSLFLLSDLVIAHGVSRAAAGADLVQGHTKFMGEMSAAAEHLMEFAKAYMAAAWHKHFGQEMLAKDVVSITGAPNVDEVILPFFVELRLREPASTAQVPADSASPDAPPAWRR